MVYSITVYLYILRCCFVSLLLSDMGILLIIDLALYECNDSHIPYVQHKDACLQWKHTEGCQK